MYHTVSRSAILLIIILYAEERFTTKPNRLIERRDVSLSLITKHDSKDEENETGHGILISIYFIR